MLARRLPAADPRPPPAPPGSAAAWPRPHLCRWTASCLWGRAWPSLERLCRGESDCASCEASEARRARLTVPVVAPPDQLPPLALIRSERSKKNAENARYFGKVWASLQESARHLAAAWERPRPSAALFAEGLLRKDPASPSREALRGHGPRSLRHAGRGCDVLHRDPAHSVCDGRQQQAAAPAAAAERGAR